VVNNTNNIAITCTCN